MRAVVTLSHLPHGENCRCPASIAVEWECDRVGSEEPEGESQGTRDRAVPSEGSVTGPGCPISIFLGGPHDEQVRRAIPEGEHIVEDPAFDPIGFYGLVRIDRGIGQVVQFFRWIEVRNASA
jgi:hypothetical protein